MPQITDFLHVLQTILWEAVRDILNKSMKGLLKYCFESLYTFGEHHCLIVLLLVAISIRIISMYLEKGSKTKVTEKNHNYWNIGYFPNSLIGMSVHENNKEPKSECAKEK
jgi:hypothetical protein